MLRDLHIRNLAVVEEASVELEPGLNVLTGETGAGKSIVVDALALLAGARASSDLLRSGARVLSVAGRFEAAGAPWQDSLEEAGVDGGDDLLVRREIQRSGRNRVFVNDQPATLKLLSSVAGPLLRIHAQREELGLATQEVQRALLDRAGGEEAVELLEATGSAHRELRAAADRLARVSGDERLRRERIDLLRFQIGEIKEAGVEEGEEVRLREERNLLRHGEAILTSLGAAVENLVDADGAAVERLGAARRALGEIERWERHASSWGRQLEEAEIQIAEVARAVRSLAERVEVDPARLDAVEGRLAILERLCRKYGGATAAVLAHLRASREELAELDADADRRDELEERVEAALEDYGSAAGRLSRARVEWAESLAERVHRELSDLGLGKARFAVSLEPRWSEGGALRMDGRGVEGGGFGYDRVALQLAANPGEELRPLARSASGGELSRIYLAVQLASRGKGAAADCTMVFDEADAGLGGAAASALGRKLQHLAAGGQILAVTHLAQVASFADHHLRVTKRVRERRTVTAVEPLGRQERVEEIARMLAGDEVTEVSRTHAEELLGG